MAESSAAFDSFERKWLDANPEQMAVLNFLDSADRRLASAFGALIHELTQTVFAIRETQVAAAKLSWWQHELLGASTGKARHPITIELFADPRARSVDPQQWTALIDGAMAQLDERAVGTFAQQRDQYGRFFNPVATIENALCGDASVDTTSVANLWLCSHWLAALAEGSAFAEHFSLPLDLFARRGVTRATAEQGEQRVEIVRDFLAEIRKMLDAAVAAASTASIGCRVRSRVDRKLATAATRSDRPQAVLAQPKRPSPLHVWWAWREARAARHRT